MLEAMAYKMQPAGHEEPQKRRKYEKTEAAPIQAFVKWLDAVPRMDENEEFEYKRAQTLLTKKSYSIEDVNALLLNSQGHPNFEKSGLFISAMLNKLKEKTIIFDLSLDTKIEYLGYRLSKDRILISKVPTGSSFGSDTEGVVINESETGFFMCHLAEGLGINYGKAGLNLGDSSKNILNYGIAASNAGEEANFFINVGETEEECARFIQRLAVNLGKTGLSFGEEAKADSTLVNAGYADKGFANAAGGRIVAAKAPTTYGKLDSAKLIFREDECSKYPKLGKLLQDLKEQLEKGRNDYREAIKAMKSLKADKLDDRIRSALEVPYDGW